MPKVGMNLTVRDSREGAVGNVVFVPKQHSNVGTDATFQEMKYKQLVYRIINCPDHCNVGVKKNDGIDVNVYWARIEEKNGERKVHIFLKGQCVNSSIKYTGLRDVISILHWWITTPNKH